MTPPSATPGSTLHTQDLGTSGSRVVFCHGLFGQGRNWLQFGKALADRHRVTLVDMPNHGRSPWDDRMDYVSMADQVAALLDPADPVALVGHSMGGKAAMVLALRHPELVERLCVVDMAPVDYENGTGFVGYLDALAGIDLATLTTRQQADDAIAGAVPDPGVRAFLLQNLSREGGGWTWRPNLAVLRKRLPEISAWPAAELAGLPPYDGRVLWVDGADSGYITEESVPVMQQLFPRVRRVSIKGAGHWVHSEQPQVFGEVLARFVDRP